jgi:hypothetical protein
MSTDGNAPGPGLVRGAKGCVEAAPSVAQRRPQAAERRQRRELRDEAVFHQARALADFVARGGAASRWLDSKGFTSEDRVRVLVALLDLEDEASGMAS